MKMKKLLSLGLAAVSALAMSATAMAYTAPSDVTITVPSTDTHAYEVYQIFTGNVDEDGKLNNIKWGKNKPASKTEGAFVSQDEIEALQNALIVDASGISTDALHKNDATELSTIETYVDLTSTPIISELTKDTAASNRTVKSGYYLIKDKSTTMTGQDTFSQYIVQVAKDITVSRKAATSGSTPTVDKQADAKQGIDAKEGDTINYTIKVTLPDNVLSYKAYKFVVEDTIGNGLTYSGTPKLYYYKNASDTTGTEITLTNEATYANLESATTAKYATSAKTTAAQAKFAVCSGDIIANTTINPSTGSSLGAASYFVIKYSAKVNSSATTGLNGANSNTATLKYTNNPNTTTMTTLNTAPQDPADVYTYKLSLKEVDTDSQPISGMTVKLSRKNDADDNYTEIASVTTGADGTAVFNRIEAGTYKLEETGVPANFSQHDAITFTVTSSISEAGKLTGLTTNLGSQDTVTNASADYKTGVIGATVSNYSSVALPVTGTMGIVMLAGAAVAACGTALGMRIKSKKEDEEVDEVA